MLNDGNLRPVSVTTAAGDGSLSRTVTTTYDPVGNVTSVTEPMGSSNTPTTTVYLWDAARQKIGEIGPAPTGNGDYRAQRITYDLDGRVTLDETGYTTSQSDTTLSTFVSLLQHAYVYDNVGRKIQESESGGGSTSTLTQYSYDALDRLICSAVRMNVSAFASLSFAAGSAPSNAACNLGSQGGAGPDRITYRSYDAAGQLTQTVLGYGTSVQTADHTSTYTLDGKEATAADGNGNLTTFTYDGFDRLSYVNYPNPNSAGSSSSTDYEQYVYDAASNIVQDRRRDGEVVSKTYDALNRLVYTTLPVAPTTFTLDNFGRLVTATRGDQGLNYTYDALGRETSEFGAYGPMSFGFDLAGDLTKITWPDGFYVQYVYDTAGEATKILENGATSGVGVLATYSYDQTGRRTQVTRGNGVTTVYGYDNARRLNALTQCLPSNPSPCSAANANFENEAIAGYNPANQIIQLTLSNPAFTWSPAVVSTSYGVNGQNQLTSVGGAPMSYDGRGNISSDSVNSYIYDSDNNLTAFNGSATMRSDPVGRLMEVSELSGGNLTTGSRWFRYHGSDILAEYGMIGSDNGILHRRYVPGPETDEVVVWYDSADTTQRRWLLTDHQGSVTAVTDVNANVLAINTYSEYGVPGSGNLGRFQYTGQIWIPEVGLYHYKARDYAPTLGRFMQTDPVGYKDGLNWYDYVHNDPVNDTDPDGTADCAVGQNCPPPPPPPTTTLPEVVVTAHKTNSNSRSNIISEAVIVAGKIARQSSATIRKAWERATGGTWPKDPATGRNQDVSHIKARADGGDDSPGNVKPQPHDEHMKDHMENGDFKRWGARSGGGRTSTAPPPEPVEPIGPEEPIIIIEP